MNKIPCQEKIKAPKERYRNMLKELCWNECNIKEKHKQDKLAPTGGRGQLNVVLCTPPHREDILRTGTAPHGRPASIAATDHAVNLHLEEELASNFRNCGGTD